MLHLSKPIIGKEEIKNVTAVLKSGVIAQGQTVRNLETKFARYCNTKYAIAFNSGTAALHSGLYALGIKKGDEVITSPFTFIATANVILMMGARPVFADIRKEDFNLNPEKVAEKITSKTKAIIPVDLYGQTYDYDGLKSVIGKKNIPILEDACQAVGAKYKSKKAGQLGDAAAFSLYATKNITSGEGGILTTDNIKIMNKAKMFRHHGQSEKKRYEYLDLGYNYRLTNILAAIGLAQLNKISTINRLRIKNALYLIKNLEGIPGLILPVIGKNNTHVFHQFTIRIDDKFVSNREKFIKYLKNNGIDSGIYYPKPIHLAYHLKFLNYKIGDFPVSENMAKEVLSLPVHPLLTKRQLDYIINKIKAYVN